MKQRSYEQSQLFSWDKSASRVLQVYEEVGGSNRHDDEPAELQNIASD